MALLIYWIQIRKVVLYKQKMIVGLWLVYHKIIQKNHSFAL